MRIAIIENNKVLNIVDGDPKKVANLFDETVTETDSTNQPWIGAIWNGQTFQPVKPYESWLWNEQGYTWEPPTEKPQGDYYWNELEKSWLAIEPIQVEEIDPEVALAEQQALKESANAKLEALGLSSEEIAAITGA